MKKTIRIITLLLSIGTLLSCEKDASDIFIVAEPSSRILQAGDRFFFDITIHSRVGKLKECSVSSFDNENGLRELPPFQLDVIDYTDKYYLQAPSDFSVDTLRVTYTFKVKSEQGHTNYAETNIYVANAKGKLLEELTSLELSTSGNDALMIDTYQPINHGAVEKPDIVLTTSQQSDSWTTGSDIMFVRINSFDYPSATYSSVSSVFRNSVRVYRVDNLSEGDVIVFGRVQKTGDEITISPEGVAKIVSHSPGQIRFNIKKR